MMKRLALLLALCLCLCFLSCASAEGTTLTVAGSGVVYVTADTVRVSLGVEETSKDVRKAQAAVNEKINAVCEALKEAGLAAVDIATQSIYISGEYDYSGSRTILLGYTASNTIVIRTSDIDKIGTYIDIAFEHGANSLRDVEFSISDSEEATKQALTLAVENALSKAEVIASAAGRKVASIQHIEEARNNYGYDGMTYSTNMREKADEALSDTVVSAASLNVTAAVEITFILTDPE